MELNVIKLLSEQIPHELDQYELDEQRGPDLCVVLERDGSRERQEDLQFVHGKAQFLGEYDDEKFFPAVQPLQNEHRG
jgi:hypothetical protein